MGLASWKTWGALICMRDVAITLHLAFCRAKKLTIFFFFLTLYFSQTGAFYLSCTLCFLYINQALATSQSFIIYSTLISVPKYFDSCCMPLSYAFALCYFDLNAMHPCNHDLSSPTRALVKQAGSGVRWSIISGQKGVNLPEKSIRNHHIFILMREEGAGRRSLTWDLR